MIEDKNVVYLKKKGRKPLAIGIYEGGSYGTRACIFQRYKDDEPTDFFYVNVWEQRNNWNESSWYGRYIELHSVEECKKWMTENLGGTWVKMK
jgi:hypothetical protein